ncbi:hypothetical protein, partial [Xanthomonas euvesicatoria]|uniref:hypothetical protein n=1 Tax=Xanthomonas euvesicatoria TaxID=456327 RepID=UPI003B682832
PLKNLSQAQSAIFADRMMLEDGEGTPASPATRQTKRRSSASADLIIDAWWNGGTLELGRDSCKKQPKVS